MVTISWVVAGRDEIGAGTEPRVTEAVALVTGIRMLGAEGTGEGPELSATGEVELSLCPGAGEELGRVRPVDAAGVEAAGGTHFVQIVDVTVLRIVDTVKELWTIVLEPDVIVFVTGHVVRVV